MTFPFAATPPIPVLIDPVSGALTAAGTPVVPAAIPAAISANAQLGALAPAVNQAIQAALTTFAAQPIQAASVVFNDATSVQAWRPTIESSIAAGGASDPIVTSAPSLAGTVGVGNALTVTRGAVTNGSGGAHQDVLSWYYVTAAGAVSLVFTETIASASTPSTYTQLAAQIGGSIFVIQQAKDTVSGRLSKSQTSNIKGPVTGTAPTNTGAAPSFTESGSVASTTLIHLNAGGWTAAATYVYYVFLAGALIYTSQSTASTAVTLQLDATYVGALTMGVIATSSSNVPSGTSPTMAGAGLTVTGAAPVITVASAFAFPTNVYMETPATVTEGTYNRNGVLTTPDIDPASGLPLVYHDFGLSTAPPGTYFRTNNKGPTFTPHAVGDGLATGSVVFCDSRPVFGGVIYGPFRSATKAIQATPATLAVTASSAAQAGITATVNASLTPVTLGTITGGSGQYSTVALTGANNPALPANLAASIIPAAGGNPATVQLSGAPGAQQSASTITVTVTDSAAAQATMAFVCTVSPAGVVALTEMTPAVASGVTVTNLDGSNIQSTWNGTTNIVGSDSIVRMGPVTDPNGSGRSVILTRVVGVSGSSSVANQRAELQGDNPQNCLTAGVRRCIAFGLLRKVGESASASSGDDSMLVWQTHTPMSGDTQPGLCLVYSRQIGVRFKAAYQNAAPSGGSTSDASNVYIESARAMAAEGVWDLYVLDWTPGWQSSHNPFLQIWNKRGSGAWTLLTFLAGGTTYSGFTTHNDGGLVYQTEYPRIGPYKYSGSLWNDPSIATLRTPLYMEAGSGKVPNGQQALAGLA